MSTLSEAMLRDLRVADARIAVVQIGPGGVAQFPRSGRATLHIVIEGEVDIVLAGEASRHLRRGDVALVFYGDEHSAAASPASRPPQFVDFLTTAPLPEEPPLAQVGRAPWQAWMISCTLEISYLEPSAPSIRAAPSLWSVNDNPTGGAAKSFDPDLLERATRGLGATAVLTFIAQTLLACALRDIYERVWHNDPKEVRAPSTRRVAAAVQAIHAHPARPWTNARLAQSVGLSRSRFVSAFSEQMGEAPAAYVARIRLERAADMLQSGSMPVAEVAMRTGYPVASSFARAFTRHYGLSPKRYIRSTARRSPRGDTTTEPKDMA